MALKVAIKGPVTELNPLFYHGERKIAIILARLRMNCSDLKGHLFDLNIINDSRCRCGNPREDTIHYLLVCPLYTNSRAILHTTVIPITRFTVRNLLYGDKNLETETNLMIYNALIQFIKESNRFVI